MNFILNIITKDRSVIFPHLHFTLENIKKIALRNGLYTTFQPNVTIRFQNWNKIIGVAIPLPNLYLPSNIRGPGVLFNCDESHVLPVQRAVNHLLHVVSRMVEEECCGVYLV